MSHQKNPVTPADLCQIISLEDPRLSPDARWLAYVQVTVDQFENTYKRNIFLIAPSGGQPIQLTRSGKDTTPRWSSDGKTLAFVSSRDEKPQIYLLPIAEPGGEARPLTSMPNGAANPAWSPDGTHIAFLAGMNADLRAKEDAAIEDPRPADKLEGKYRKERREYEETKRYDPRIVERIPYRAGTSFLTDHFQQIYVMPAAEGLERETARPRRLTDANADYGPPQWTPDGKSLLTFRIGDPAGDEPWRWSNLYRIALTDGTHQQLTDENFTSFTPLPSPDGRWIAFGRAPREQISERITRLAVMPAAGGEARDITLELDRNIGDFRWLPNSSGLLFTASDHGNIELYRLTLEDGTIEKIVAGTIHIESFDLHSAGTIAYSAATTYNPSELFHLPAASASPTQITNVNDKWLESVAIQENHELRWQSPSGTEIQGWYVLPPDFEPGEKYPLIVNIHGGPHVMWGPAVKACWQEWQFQGYAAQGYVVFYCNPRGADGYGEAFQMALHGEWGDVAYQDIMAGVDALLEKGFVDEEKMAVTGGSYGGYMAAWIVGHTDRFKAACAQRGVYNLLGFPGTTDIPSFIPTEFGVESWENPTFLWERSPLAYAHQIKTPLLLIHSENDFRVPISEAEQMFSFVRRTGGTVKLIRFPREGHELTRSGEPEHRIANINYVIEWFDRYCK